MISKISFYLEGQIAAIFTGYQAVLLHLTLEGLKKLFVSCPNSKYTCQRWTDKSKCHQGCPSCRIVAKFCASSLKKRDTRIFAPRLRHEILHDACVRHLAVVTKTKWSPNRASCAWLNMQLTKGRHDTYDMKIKKIPLQFWIFGKGTYFTKMSVMSIENGVVYVYLRSASFVSEFAIMIIFARL